MGTGRREVVVRDKQAEKRGLRPEAKRERSWMTGRAKGGALRFGKPLLCRCSRHQSKDQSLL